MALLGRRHDVGIGIVEVILVQKKSFRVLRRECYLAAYGAARTIKSAFVGRPVESRYKLHWVSPKDIHCAVTGPTSRKTGLFIPYIEDSDWDRLLDLPESDSLLGDLSLLPTGKIPIERMDIYQAFQDRFLGGHPWQTTDMFARVSNQIACGQRKWNCGSVQEFEARLASMDRLYEAIQNDGYKTQEELGTKKVWHEIAIGEARDGELVLVDGRHRFLMCKMLGVDPVPTVVAVKHRARS